MDEDYWDLAAANKLKFLDVDKAKLYLTGVDSPRHLRSLQALELALRTGSLRAAAAHLAITPAAVGQRVKALEDYLGVDLIVRGRSGLQPTPELTAAVPHLQAAFRELAQAGDLLELQRGQQIRIATVTDLAELWLQPRLARFSMQYPNVEFTMSGGGDGSSPRVPADVEISFSAIDPAVRDSVESDLLFHDYLLPIASVENEQRIARLPRRRRLEGFPLLHVDFYRDDAAAPRWPDWLRANRLARLAPERGIRFQRIAPAVDAVLANAGLALCGIALLKEPIEAGRLSTPFGIKAGRWTAHAFQARYRAGGAARPALRQFRQWLRAEAVETRTWLMAHVPTRPT